MHTVHNVSEDVDEFTFSPRVFLAANKIIHGGLQRAGEVILQDWIVCEIFFLNKNVYRLQQWHEEVLCAHLHEEPLLPQFSVEEENIWICPDHAGVKVHDPQTLKAPSPRQGHVGLAALKHTCQRDFHTVQCHSLKQMVTGQTEQYWHFVFQNKAVRRSLFSV